MFLTESLSAVLQTPVVHPGYRHVYHQYTIRVPDTQDRNEWAKILGARGVGTGIHYPVAIHQQPYYQQHGEKFRCLKAREHTAFAMALPAAESAARQVLSLPVHPALNEDDLITIVREVRALCG
jgi:perosamine synthetase